MNLRRIVGLASFGLSLAVAAPASADGGGGSTLLPGDILFAGQRVVSDECNYHLDMQYDGNLVLYAGTGDAASAGEWNSWSQGATLDCTRIVIEHNGVAHCVSTRWSWTVPYADPAYAALQASDGNFVEYGDDSGSYPVLWATNTTTNSHDVLWVQNDGNVVLYPATSPGLASSALWETNTVGTEGPPASCNIKSQFTEIEQNTNLDGNVFNYVCTNDVMACGTACSNAENQGLCAGWSFFPAGSPGFLCPATLGSCYLKGAVTGTAASPGTTSGVIRTSN